MEMMRIELIHLWTKQDLNPQPSVRKTDALPVELFAQNHCIVTMRYVTTDLSLEQ